MPTEWQILPLPQIPPSLITHKSRNVARAPAKGLTHVLGQRLRITFQLRQTLVDFLVPKTIRRGLHARQHVMAKAGSWTSSMLGQSEQRQPMVIFAKPPRTNSPTSALGQHPRTMVDQDRRAPRNRQPTIACLALFDPRRNLAASSQPRTMSHSRLIIPPDHQSDRHRRTQPVMEHPEASK